jgi:hypothetical protein
VPDLNDKRNPLEKTENVTAPIATPAPAIHSAPTESKRIPRVAVLGVHGVGQHAPGATENAMADLLFSLPAKRLTPRGWHIDRKGPRHFGFFRSVGVQVPLQPLHIKKPLKKRRPDGGVSEAGTREGGVGGGEDRDAGADPGANDQPRMGLAARAMDLYQEQSTDFAELATDYGKENKEHVPRGKAGNAFMKLLLQDYKGGADGDAYITTRLEGKRSAEAPGGEANVHIYEVLWADLASPNNTILSFFLALFQLILHLGSLSRLAIDTGAAENTGSLWQIYLASQRYAVRMLQIFIPLAKVILLIVLFSCIPALLDATKDSPGFSVVIFGLAGAVLSFLILSRAHKPVTVQPWLWAILVLIPAALGAAIGFLASHLGTPAAAGSIACWLFLGIPLLFYVLHKYEGVRKGVEITGWVVYGVCFLIFAGYLYFNPAGVSQELVVPQATFWTVEWVVAAIRTSWLFLLLFAFLALALGSLAWRSQKDLPKRARARAAVRTSRFALALPAVLFLLITSMLWDSMFFIAKKVQTPFFDPKVLCPPFGGNWLLHLHVIPDPKNLPSTGDYLQGVLAWSVGYQLPITLGLFTLALFLLIWWALPAAITERFPLRDQKEPPRSSTNLESVRLGTWLSRGLDATSVVIFLFWCAIFLAPPAFYFLPHAWQCYLMEWTVHIVSGFALAASGAVIAAIVKYGSPMLGAVLDVDTYLRTSPPDATPRAKIVERYVSTLRYLARHRDADGRGYDSVVIVAHSLGSLISADLLRFLYSDGDPELAAFGLAGDQKPGTISLSLLTMGNPTRQLLNRFIPYLYDWMRDKPDNGLRPLPDPVLNPPATIPADSLPDPAELGVTKWVNTYRSGDYVGRSLWLDEWYRRTDGTGGDGRYPQEIHEANLGRRSEMCIGAGAHTHYWDDTAPDVAEVLNSLI